MVFLLALVSDAVGEDFIEWVELNYALTIENEFNSTHQTEEGSIDLTLHHNVAVNLSIDEVETDSRLLTSSTEDTLTTSYKLSGNNLTPSDTEYKSADDFIVSTYQVAKPGTDYSTMTFYCQGESHPVRANDKGTYTSKIRITAVLQQ